MSDRILRPFFFDRQSQWFHFFTQAEIQAVLLYAAHRWNEAITRGTPQKNGRDNGFQWHDKAIGAFGEMGAARLLNQYWPTNEDRPGADVGMFQVRATEVPPEGKMISLILYGTDPAQPGYDRDTDIYLRVAVGRLGMPPRWCVQLIGWCPGYCWQSRPGAGIADLSRMSKANKDRPPRPPTRNVPWTSLFSLDPLPTDADLALMLERRIDPADYYAQRIAERKKTNGKIIFGTNTAAGNGAGD